MEERAQLGPAIVPWPGPSEWGFVSSPAATVHAPSLDFGSHVALAVLTGRLCAAVGMCVCVCMGWTERSGGKSFVSQHRDTPQICGSTLGLTCYFKELHSVPMELQGTECHKFLKHV